VEVLVEGDVESVDRMEWSIRRGPPLARVDDVSTSEEAATGRPVGFRIEA
jgi:acylphosphatase